MDVKTVVKNLFNDDYDSTTCYEELLNCVSEFNIEDFKDVKQFEYAQAKVLEYFDRCTCPNDTLHELSQMLDLADDTHKEKYIAFLNQLEAPLFEEIVKSLKGEENKLFSNQSEINSKPLAEMIFGAIYQQLHSSDYSYLMELLENDNAHLLKAYVNETPEILNVVNEDVGSLLHMSALVSANDILAYLLTLVKDVNLQNASKETALHMAYKGNNVEGVKLLIDHNASRVHPNQDGVTPNSCCLFLEDSSVINDLVEEGYLNIDFAINEETITSAMNTGNKGFIVYALEKKLLDIDMKMSNSMSLMSLACFKGNFDVVKYLISKGKDIATQSTTVSNIVLAFMSANKDLIDYFLEDDNFKNITDEDKKFIYKYTCDKPQVFYYAEEKIGDLDNYIIDVLRTAIDEKAVEIINYMLERDFDYCVELNDNHTLLTVSAVVGIESITRKIMNKETVEHANKTGKPFLFHLVDNLLFGVLEDAINLGVDKTLRHQVGTVLTRAIYRNPRPEIIQYLLDQGFDISDYNSNGYTPLHMAARVNRLDVCELLVAHGAKPHEANKLLKKSPLKIAKEQKNKEIVKFFKTIKK